MNEWLAARNILAVRLDNIGDVIMLEPALRAVKETSPHARLTLLASNGGATAAPLLPWIEEQWCPRATFSRLLRRPTPCHPCYLFACPIGQPCLDIPPEEVAAEIEQLLAESRSSPIYRGNPIHRESSMHRGSPAHDGTQWLITGGNL